MRRILTALIIALGLASLSGPALGAVCTPTPALPDTERRTEYAGIVAQTGPFNVGFQLYGDGTDYGNWVSVWVNGVALTPVTDFTVTSPSGPLANLCRPISDAQVTFTAAQTGTIEIEGSRRPRRTSQASENAGITARTFNQVVSDMTAQLRERWDRQSRLMRSPPGETLNVLPPAATRANQVPCFDSLGQLTLCPTIVGAPIPAGIDTNALATGAFITTATPADITFCGKTAALGGAAFYTFTVGAPTGFPAACSITVINLDTARGKKIAISGVTFPNNSILRPSQSFTLKNEGGSTWTIVNSPGRKILSTSLALFVDPAGNDSNDGLAAGAGGAFATLAQALTEVCSYIDLNFQTVVVNAVPGTYPGVAACQYVGYNGRYAYSQVIIKAGFKAVTISIASPCVVTLTAHGRLANDVIYFETSGALPTGLSAATPYQVSATGLAANTFQVKDGAGTTINCTGTQSGAHEMTAPVDSKISATAPGTTVGGVGVFNTSVTTPMDWRGFQFINCTTQCFYLDSGGVANIQDVDFAACTCIQIQAILGGRLRTLGYSISGGASYHAATSSGGTIFGTGRPILLTNTPAFVSNFAISSLNGLQQWNGSTFVGSGATGSRFNAETGGGIFTGSAGLTFLPGNAAGTVANPGWYY